MLVARLDRAPRRQQIDELGGVVREAGELAGSVVSPHRDDGLGHPAAPSSVQSRKDPVRTELLAPAGLGVARRDDEERRVRKLGILTGRDLLAERNGVSAARQTHVDHRGTLPPEVLRGQRQDGRVDARAEPLLRVAHHLEERPGVGERRPPCLVVGPGRDDRRDLGSVTLRVVGGGRVDDPVPRGEPNAVDVVHKVVGRIVVVLPILGVQLGLVDGQETLEERIVLLQTGVDDPHQHGYERIAGLRQPLDLRPVSDREVAGTE